MKVLIVSGSMAKKSHTRGLLRYIKKLLNEQKVVVSMWDLYEKPLPPLIAEYHSDPTKHPDKRVRAFAEVVDTADAVILASPLYHGSYSGDLKLALDNLKKDALKDKFVALVGNAGGARSDHIQFSHLRDVVKTLYGYTTQTTIGTHGDDYKELENEFELVNENIQERCKRLTQELIVLTRKKSS